MAIKERKQITGTEAQIKGYAGHNGVLAYATDTKHLHVLSGTAGTTTKLANVSDIPAPVDISGKADTTYVNAELAKKQAKGDYATNTALTQGLAGKANTSHTHTKSQITDFPEIPDTSTLIPKTEDRGILSGYESWSYSTESTISIRVNTPDSLWITPSSNILTFEYNPTLSAGKVATKLVWIDGSKLASAPTIRFRTTTGSDVRWFGGSAPTFKKTSVLMFLAHPNLVDVSMVGTWD